MDMMDEVLGLLRIKVVRGTRTESSSGEKSSSDRSFTRYLVHGKIFLDEVAFPC